MPKVLLTRVAFALGIYFSACSVFASDTPGYGVTFSCSKAPGALKAVHQQLRSWGIRDAWVTRRKAGQTLSVALKPSLGNSNTLNIASNPIFGIGADVVTLQDPRRQAKAVPTVSKKEIVLALLHPGRLTAYSGADCGLEQFKDDVGVRQTTVAWAQTVSFGWPEGTPSKWNEVYWNNGTPKQGVNLWEALTDMAITSGDYSVGCYAAAKGVLAAAQLDYYTRVKNNPIQAKKLEATLMTDGEPLVNLEPGEAWHFEKDFNAEDLKIPGKIIDLQKNVAAKNFVPGDWLYILNTDPVTYEKTGYEGSNAIYLGMNRFTDYYNDHEHSYNFVQKVHEVYQWRHHVFSRSRDAGKVEKLTDKDYDRLAEAPTQGGLLINHRMVPRWVPSN